MSGNEADRKRFAGLLRRTFVVDNFLTDPLMHLDIVEATERALQTFQLLAKTTPLVVTGQG